VSFDVAWQVPTSRFASVGKGEGVALTGSARCLGIPAHGAKAKRVDSGVVAGWQWVTP
jgi:hypothetical protein